MSIRLTKEGLLVFAQGKAYLPDSIFCAGMEEEHPLFSGWPCFWRTVKLTKKIYVGNLSFNATEEQVRELFAEFGTIESLAMITDRDSGRFRGFCFVEMEDSAANAAINALNGKVLDDRDLRVNEARPREDRGGNRGGGGYRGGGNRGGRGGNRGRTDSYGSGHDRW